MSLFLCNAYSSILFTILHLFDRSRPHQFLVGERSDSRPPLGGRGRHLLVQKKQFHVVVFLHLSRAMSQGSSFSGPEL